MTTKEQRAKSQFRTKLEAAELSQRTLSRLLGVSNVTVNRWCISKRDDALGPPAYAVVFLEAWVRMSGADRRELLAKRGISADQAAA